MHHNLFANQVHQVIHIVLGAPLGLHAEEAVFEDVAPNVVVVGLDALRLVGHLTGEELRDVGLQVVAFLLPKFIQQLGGPRYGAGVVRFIAKETQDRGAEVRAEKLLVHLVGGRQEGPRGVRIQVIDHGIQGIFVVGAVCPIDVARRGTPVDMAHEHHVPEEIRGVRIGAGVGRGPGEVTVLRHREHRGGMV